VAIKLINAGMDATRVGARFEAERQALALMDHSHIAHVYDAGTTTDGRLFFAMEYVDGASLTQFCDTNRLGIKARLDLFSEVTLRPGCPVEVIDLCQRGIQVESPQAAPSGHPRAGPPGRRGPPHGDAGRGPAVPRPGADSGRGRDLSWRPAHLGCRSAG
jgi:hypothetical protein